MVSRTIVDSIERVDGPPVGVAELELALAQLRWRFPGVVLRRYLEHVPEIGEDVFVAEGAAIIGQVRLREQASVWYQAVLRGDLQRIDIGARSNVQDGAVIHVGDQDAAVVGEDVVIGHRAMIHGCVIEDACLIGMQSTILDGAVIGAGSVVGSCALVTAGTVIPPRSLVLGVPGKVVKTLTDAEVEFHRALAAKYCRLAHNYLRG